MSLSNVSNGEVHQHVHRSKKNCCKGFICKEPNPRQLTVELVIDGKNQTPHIELQTGISRNRKVDSWFFYVQLFFVFIVLLCFGQLIVGLVIVT